MICRHGRTIAISVLKSLFEIMKAKWFADMKNVTAFSLIANVNGGKFFLQIYINLDTNFVHQQTYG